MFTLEELKLLYRWGDDSYQYTDEYGGKFTKEESELHDKVEKMIAELEKQTGEQ